MSRDTMIRIAHERHEAFDMKRREAEAVEADADNVEELEKLERQLAKKARNT
jgi:hypothetical protein